MRIIRMLMAAVACCIFNNAWAVTEINVETAGTLSSLLTTTDTGLKLTGSINGTDVKYLRQLVNDGKVTSLDLSEVKIVSGGVAYYESYKTTDNAIGEYMFSDCKKLRTVVLPTTVNAILTNAFARSGLTKVDIPNSVNRLGMDAFAYCSSLTTVVIGSKVQKLDQGVFYSSPVKYAYVKPLTPPSTPAYLFSSSPTIRVYTEVLAEYKASTWKQYGTIVGNLEKDYPREPEPSEIVNNLRSTYFEDAACTQLKAEYQAMTDEELTAAMTEGGMPEFMTAIALKLKNDQWAAYEKDFRIHSYGAYSDASYWNDKCMSSGGSYMGNPTGIYSKDYDSIYVFVDEDVPEDATLYFAGCPGNDLITNAKTGQKLQKGVNIVDGQKDALYYIVYTADTRSMKKKIQEWPAIKIHIEGGTVNGYYDVSRHSDTDYKAIIKAATHERFTIRGGQSLFHFKTATIKKIWPSSIDKSICWFDSLTVWQKDLMGLSEHVAAGEKLQAPFCLSGGDSYFPSYYNNPNFAIQGEEKDAGYANSTPFRTAYNSEACIKNSFVIKADMDDWCAAHECGHNNQKAIQIEAGTEVSNNLFSNVIRYLDGIATSVGSPLSTIMDEYSRREPYYTRDVNSQLRLFYQLYLYYHQAGKNTSFYPELFKALRNDPLGTKYQDSYKTSLKLVRKICEIAQEDLTEFFRAYGFFEPFTNMTIEDYGSHTMTVKKTDITRTLNEIAKYPTKNRTILFIEDRADYVLNNGMWTTAGQKRRDYEQVGQCGHLGQFTSYMPDACEPSEYTYLQTDSMYAMIGTGGVGFMVLDAEGKMLTASNSRNFYIPTSVGQDFTIYSIDADGTLHETSKAGEGAEVVNLTKAGTLADSLSANAIKATISGVVNGTDIKYMRQLINQGNLLAIDLTDARMASGGVAYYDNYRVTTSNTIGSHAFYDCKKLISIYLPQKITKIEDNAFARSGLKEVHIPDAVTAIGGDAFAYCDCLNQVVVGSKVRSMSQGVFYSSPVKHAYVKPLTPPSISLYLFSSKPVIHVYARALSAYKASGWAEFGTIVGDLDDYEDIVSVENIPLLEKGRSEGDNAGVESETPFYDLLGRKVTRMEPGHIYIKDGKKVIK